MERTVTIHLYFREPVLCGLQDGIPSHAGISHQYHLDGNTIQAIFGIIGVEIDLDKIKQNQRKE